MEDLKVLLFPFLIIFALCALVLSISAMRNPVLFKMGARNFPRRPANTMLTLLGLMLAAMIFSASFATGDTLTHSIRGIAVDYLGEVDIMVMPEGAEFGAFQGHTLESADATNYFDETEFDTVSGALTSLRDDGTVEGVAPAIIETVPVVARTELNEPAVTLLGFDSRYTEGFDRLLDKHGKALSLQYLEGLGEGHVYINTNLAEALEVVVGDEIDFYLSHDATMLTIAGIYKTGGNPSSFGFDTGATAVMPISELQALRGSNKINFVLITNQGGAIDGAKHSDAVMKVLEPVLADTGLKAEPIKKDALDEADTGGAQFSTIFLVLGSFSMIAGVLLIFLIFVMLASERKPELGIARAVGTQRGHIVRLFTYEGVLYALAASAVGAALGLLVSWGGIQALASAFEAMGFEITFDFTWSGVIISYVAGVLFTLLIVVISAWRVSRLNIICAIKDIPEPQEEGKRSLKGLIVGILFSLLGLPMIAFGIQEAEWGPYSLGASFVIIGLCMLARKRPLRLPDRPAYTLAGILLLLFWLSPTDWHPRGEEMGAGFEMFILTGIMLVTAAVWIVMYNSDLLLAAVMAIFGRLRALTPMIKTAISYPMASRFRTGMAMAMFALIIFTLIYMSAMTASINALLDDTDRVTGGFDIRGEVSYTNPIADIQSALQEAPGVSPDDFQAIASFNIIPTKMRDASGTTEETADNATAGNSDRTGTETEWTDLFLVGADEGYTHNVTYGFEMTTEEYASRPEEDVWKALSDNPSLAVINAALVPTKYAQMGDNGIDLVVGEGKFLIEDEFIPDDIFIEVQTYGPHPETRNLQVIGVVDMMSGPYASMVSASSQTVDALAGGHQVLPFGYRFKVSPDRINDISEIAKNLEKAFVQNGMNTEVMSQEVKDYSKINNMFMNLMMAFMALGLIVGIAALGVIAARSVVERRHQIGMLRAIGFQQGMIQFSFLLESSFVALLGIMIGVGLGVGTALLFMSEAGIEGLKATIPWDRVILIVVATYLATLTTTFIPAYRASKIYPAEALRYE